MLNNLVQSRIFYTSDYRKRRFHLNVQDSVQEGVEAAQYSDLAAECREAGRRSTMWPVDVGCRGFVGSSTVRLLRDMGCSGTKHRRAVRELAEEAAFGRERDLGHQQGAAASLPSLRHQETYWG